MSTSTDRTLDNPYGPPLPRCAECGDPVEPQEGEEAPYYCVPCVYDDKPAIGVGRDGNTHSDPYCATIAPAGTVEATRGEPCDMCQQRREAAIEEQSLALITELRPTRLTMIEKAKRYDALKRRARYVLDDGEILDPKAYEAECESLRDELKAYIGSTGETLEVEGIPPLMVRPQSTTWYRIEALIDGDPQLWAECMDMPGLVKLDAAMVKAAQKLGKLQRLSQYEQRGNGADRLEFDRRWRG